MSAAHPTNLGGGALSVDRDCSHFGLLETDAVDLLAGNRGDGLLADGRSQLQMPAALAGAHHRRTGAHI